MALKPGVTRMHSMKPLMVGQDTASVYMLKVNKRKENLNPSPNQTNAKLGAETCGRNGFIRHIY